MIDPRRLQLTGGPQRLERAKRLSAQAAEPKRFGETTGGGAGSLLRLRVKTQHNDYLTCRTWDGTTEGSVDVLVAKPFKLRHVVGNYTGISALTTVSASSVTVTIGGTEYTWVIPAEHDYQVDNEIYAIAAQTGVTAAPSLIDANVDGRAWAREASA